MNSWAISTGRYFFRERVLRIFESKKRINQKTREQNLRPLQRDIAKMRCTIYTQLNLSRIWISRGNYFVRIREQIRIRERKEITRVLHYGWFVRILSEIFYLRILERLYCLCIVFLIFLWSNKNILTGSVSKKWIKNYRSLLIYLYSCISLANATTDEECWKHLSKTDVKNEDFFSCNFVFRVCGRVNTHMDR